MQEALHRNDLKPSELLERLHVTAWSGLPQDGSGRSECLRDGRAALAMLFDLVSNLHARLDAEWRLPTDFRSADPRRLVAMRIDHPLHDAMIECVTLACKAHDITWRKAKRTTHVTAEMADIIDRSAAFWERNGRAICNRLEIVPVNGRDDPPPS